MLDTTMKCYMFNCKNYKTLVLVILGKCSVIYTNARGVKLNMACDEIRKLK